MTKLKYLHMQKREQKENSWQEPKKKKTMCQSATKLLAGRQIKASR
jgi:hypothetical protein